MGGGERNILVNLLLVSSGGVDESHVQSSFPNHLLLYHVVSYLDPEESLLLLRSLSHPFNSNVTKLFHLILREVFPDQIRKLPVFVSWNMAGVKFINSVLPTVIEINGDKRIIGKAMMLKKKRSKRLASSPSSPARVHCDTVVEFNEVIEVAEITKCDQSKMVQEMTISELTNILVKRYKQSGDLRSLGVFLDFLSYARVILKREQVPGLVHLLLELKSSLDNLPFAYKIVKVLGHASFQSETRSREYARDEIESDKKWDMQRSRDLSFRVFGLDSTMGKKCNSVFEDGANGVCRGTVHSFRRVCK